MSKEERRNKVLEVLNKAKAMELQAIHQYMHQHYILDDMDYGELAKQVKLIAIDLRHAEALAERITERAASPQPSCPVLWSRDRISRRFSPLTPMKRTKPLRLTPSSPKSAATTATPFQPVSLKQSSNMSWTTSTGLTM